MNPQPVDRKSIALPVAPPRHPAQRVGHFTKHTTTLYCSLIFWPHRTPCGLLRQCHTYVCLLGIRVSRAKAAEPIEMPFGRLTLVGPRNRVLDGALYLPRGRGNPPPLRYDFSSKLFDHPEKYIFKYKIGATHSLDLNGHVYRLYQRVVDVFRLHCL